MFPTIRARLLVLLLLAAIPLFAMASSIAWQNYRVAVDRARQQVLPVMTALATRHEESLHEAERVLHSVAGSFNTERPIGPSCDRALEAVVHWLGQPIRNIAVLDLQGRPICNASPLPADSDSGRAAQAAALRALAAGRFEVEPVVSAAAPPQPELWAALPLSRDGKPSGSAGVLLTVDWLRPIGLAAIPASGSVAWVQARDGTFVPLGERPPPAAWLPTPPAAADILASPGVVKLLPSRTGTEFAYVAQRLRGGWQLLVAEPAADSLSQARTVFGRRMAELGLLLAAGLIAMAIGAHEWVVDPVKRLSRAVGRWRAGGPFEPGVLTGAPAETIELAQVFGQAATALRVHEAELREATLRQDLLMQEIHHRVKNNLQIVASLLNLQSSRIRVPAAQAEFQAARDRIRALATLHRHLYVPGDLHMIDMASFLEELCAQLLQALGETPAGGRIVLEIAATELRISPDQAVPVALIVTEAVSNAVKYAFPGGRGGHIQVRLEKLGDQVRLTIRDDGVGIPAGRAETESGVRDGIGIQLIRGFARQLGAQLTVVDESGTSYTIQFRLRDAAPDAAASVIPAAYPASSQVPVG